MIITKRDIFLAVNHFSELKILAHNAKIRSSLKFLLIFSNPKDMARIFNFVNYKYLSWYKLPILLHRHNRHKFTWKFVSGEFHITDLIKNKISYDLHVKFTRTFHLNFTFTARLTWYFPKTSRNNWRQQMHNSRHRSSIYQ